MTRSNSGVTRCSGSIGVSPITGRHLQVRNSVRPELRTQVVPTASTPDCWGNPERLQRTANREETGLTKEFRVLHLLSYPRSADPNRGNLRCLYFRITITTRTSACCSSTTKRRASEQLL